MKALYNQTLCVVTDDNGDGLILEPVDGDSDQQFYVFYSDKSLVVNPTDKQIEIATKETTN